MIAKLHSEHCVFHSAKAIERELEALCKSGNWFKKPVYFRLAHYLNVRTNQLALIKSMETKFGVHFRKTKNPKILRILKSET